MRLTPIILLITILQVSASTLAQRVNLDRKNVTINQIFKEIKTQTGYTVFYKSNNLDANEKISVKFSQATLAQVMDKCLEGKDLDFIIEDKTIIIVLKKKKNKDEIINTTLNFFNDIIISGKVLNQYGEPLEGATVKLKGSNKGTVTNSVGAFSINSSTESAILVISFLGYKTKEIAVPTVGFHAMLIKLDFDVAQLAGLNIVSTGYQRLPKERATGSFEKIDNVLYNRVQTTDVISRLNGTVAGLYFNKTSAVITRGSNVIDNASIRGLSSLSIVKPLVILDNIPYDGDINNLNPNDIQEVTILKDAAAASIWGARAGNGVIVLATKKGSLNKPLQISLNSNLTVIQKPDLLYSNRISSSDYIDVEKFLFSKEFYSGTLTTTDPYPPFVTPVIDVLADNSLSADEANRQINAFRNYDVRNDFLKYIYRNAKNQQYAINFSGGSNNTAYFLSAGYDKNLNSNVSSNYDRKNIKADIQVKPIKNLDLASSLLYTESRSKDLANESIINYRGSGYLSLVYPYARFADDNGNPLAVGRTYRTSFLNSLDPALLDWKYYPLDELNNSYSKNKTKDLLLNVGTKYTIDTIFSVDLKYQYNNTDSEFKNFNGKNSFYSRDLINNYTDPTTLIQAIPVGAIYQPTTTNFVSQTVRGQLNANKTFNLKHQINAIVGLEARKTDVVQRSNIFYGYDEKTGNFKNIDFETPKPLYFGGGETAQIPNQSSVDHTANRFTSIFANASYTYNNLYTLSASARKDAANVLGDNTNKRGAPLWSAGLSWNLSKEDFYKVGWLPYLKLRATHGYSGNVNNSVFAFPVITYQSPLSTTNLPYATISALPNPDLRWEKVRMTNFGVDFGFTNNRLSGSVEYYDKRSSDVIANAPIDPTKGTTFQTYNTANIHGKGVDITLNSVNLIVGDFRWNTNFIFSYHTNKVTKYLFKLNRGRDYIKRGVINPIEGKSAYAIFAFPFAGLDPENGDPQGYLNGQISKNYRNILNTNISDLKYYGSAVPEYYGSFRNTFSYKNFSLSANILYKLGYHFLRSDGMNYGSLFGSYSGSGDFANRWQNTGDEKHTNVPSMIYPNDPNRDTFYNLSEAMIEKGDHIRLQDITASYLFNKFKGIQNIKLYTNINDVGIIWRANKKNIDPDIYTGYPTPLSITFGISANF